MDTIDLLEVVKDDPEFKEELKAQLLKIIKSDAFHTGMTKKLLEDMEDYDFTDILFSGSDDGSISEYVTGKIHDILKDIFEKS